MASVFEQFALGVSAAFGAPIGEVVTPRQAVISGPVTVGGAPLPYYQSFAYAPNKQGLSRTLTLPSPYLRVTSIPQAASEFFQQTPGTPLVERAPGAAGLWEQIAQGFAPTLSAVPGVSGGGGGGFGSGVVGGVTQGAGAGLPPWIWLAGGAAILLLLVKR